MKKLTAKKGSCNDLNEDYWSPQSVLETAAIKLE